MTDDEEYRRRQRERFVRERPERRSTTTLTRPTIHEPSAYVLQTIEEMRCQRS